MTKIDTSTEAIAKLMDGVTPAPWRVGPVDDTRVEAADGSEVALIDGDYNEPDLWPIMEANARFIAAARELVPALTAERDALAAQLAAALDKLELEKELIDCAHARARESALEALSAYGQAAKAHEAKQAAEQRLATCEKYRDAYAECDRIGTDAVRALEAKVARLTAELEAVRRREDEANRAAFKHLRRAQTAEALLLRAYEAGRDDAAGVYWHGAWYRNPDALAAIKKMTPPADLAARLGGAAPDIIEALKAMRDDPTIKAVCPSPLWAQMVNAIEKAEGRG